MTPERGRGVVLVLSMLAAAATLAVVAHRDSDLMALDETSAMELASGVESPARREEIAAGGTRLFARNGVCVCGASPRSCRPLNSCCAVYSCAWLRRGLEHPQAHTHIVFMHSDGRCHRSLVCVHRKPSQREGGGLSSSCEHDGCPSHAHAPVHGSSLGARAVPTPARQRIEGTSIRVATGRDELQQMTAEQRSADEAEAAHTLQHYVAQVCVRTRARVGMVS
jgi:hypothetical protein